MIGVILDDRKLKNGRLQMQGPVTLETRRGWKLRERFKEPNNMKTYIKVWEPSLVLDSFQSFVLSLLLRRRKKNGSLIRSASLRCWVIALKHFPRTCVCQGNSSTPAFTLRYMPTHSWLDQDRSLNFEFQFLHLCKMWITDLAIYIILFQKDAQDSVSDTREC